MVDPRRTSAPRAPVVGRRVAGWTRARDLHGRWSAHPRLAMAARAAVAVALAWLLARAVPGPASDYPYYAPMGATIAITLSLSGAVRQSLQAVGAIALGVVIAVVGGLLGDLVADPGPAVPVVVAAVVAAGVLVAGWRRLGEMGAWVTTAALFTLIIGRDDPVGFIGAYTGLTLLGALVGIAVNWAFPPLPLAPAHVATVRVRDALVDQLRELATGLEGDDPPDAAGWDRRHRDLAPLLGEMRRAVLQARDARRWNRRTRRYAEPLERHDRQVRALERVALLVEDLTDTLVREERAENAELALGRALRPATARALRRLADVLAVVEGTTQESDEVPRAAAALAELSDEIRAADRRPGSTGTFVASAVAVTIRRCLDAVLEPAAPGRPGPPAAGGDGVRPRARP